MCSACGHIKLLITITLTFSDMDHETLITYIHDGYIYIYSLLRGHYAYMRIPAKGALSL